MALGLIVASIFSIYTFTAHDNNDWAENHNFIVPAFTHFDANRNARAILAIR
jgi:hypothetical protein